MKQYIGTKIIHAEPALKFDDGRIMPIDYSDPKSFGKNGYKVVYEDGYTSWSPKDAFEKAYRQTNGVNFGLAIEAVKSGKGMRLPSWKPDVVVRAQFPDEHSKMTAPYLYVESRFGRVPWKETMIELFSDKWEIVD